MTADPTPSQTTGAAEPFSIRDKVALVAGGSRGIGTMIARGFGEAGVRVYVTCRDAHVCEQVAADDLVTTAGPSAGSRRGVVRSPLTIFVDFRPPPAYPLPFKALD